MNAISDGEVGLAVSVCSSVGRGFINGAEVGGGPVAKDNPSGLALVAEVAERGETKAELKMIEPCAS